MPSSPHSKPMASPSPSPSGTGTGTGIITTLYHRRPREGLKTFVQRLKGDLSGSSEAAGDVTLRLRRLGPFWTGSIEECRLYCNDDEYECEYEEEDDEDNGNDEEEDGDYSSVEDLCYSVADLRDLGALRNYIESYFDSVPNLGISIKPEDLEKFKFPVDFYDDFDALLAKDFASTEARWKALRFIYYTSRKWIGHNVRTESFHDLILHCPRSDVDRFMEHIKDRGLSSECVPFSFQFKPMWHPHDEALNKMLLLHYNGEMDTSLSSDCKDLYVDATTCRQLKENAFETVFKKEILPNFFKLCGSLTDPANATILARGLVDNHMVFFYRPRNNHQVPRRRIRDDASLAAAIDSMSGTTKTIVVEYSTSHIHVKQRDDVSYFDLADFTTTPFPSAEAGTGVIVSSDLLDSTEGTSLNVEGTLNSSEPRRTNNPTETYEKQSNMRGAGDNLGADAPSEVNFELVDLSKGYARAANCSTIPNNGWRVSVIGYTRTSVDDFMNRLRLEDASSYNGIPIEID